MNTEKHNRKSDGKQKSLFGSVFPQEYNFEAMLVEQAEHTLAGMEIYIEWIQEDSPVAPDTLIKTGQEVDIIRYRLEEKLMDAFSTPFNRQDIYTLSRNIDYILNYAVDTAREMHAFDVCPDRPIRDMSTCLLHGTRQVVEGTRNLGKDKGKVEECIRKGRIHVHTIENCYIACMADLFRTDDAMEAMKKREIYHHLRDGGEALRKALYIMHKAVVGLA